MTTSEQKQAELRRAALEYHEFPTPGKIAIAATTAGQTEERMLADCSILIETHQGNGNR